VLLKHGVKESIIRMGDRPQATDGFDFCVKAGRSDIACEAIILRHREEAEQRLKATT